MQSTFMSKIESGLLCLSLLMILLYHHPPSHLLTLLSKNLRSTSNFEILVLPAIYLASKLPGTAPTTPYPFPSINILLICWSAFIFLIVSLYPLLWSLDFAYPRTCPPLLHLRLQRCRKSLILMLLELFSILLPPLDLILPILLALWLASTLILA